MLAKNTYVYLYVLMRISKYERKNIIFWAKRRRDYKKFGERVYNIGKYDIKQSTIKFFCCFYFAKL